MNAIDIEWVLAQRPEPATRNWFPHEHLDDLLRENIEHGIVPAGLGEGETLHTLNGRVVDLGALSGGSRLELGGV